MNASNPHEHQVDLLNATIERAARRASALARLRDAVRDCPRAIVDMAEREIAFCNDRPGVAAGRLRAVSRHLDACIAHAASDGSAGDRLRDRIISAGVTGFDLRIAAEAFAAASSSLEGN